MARKEYKTIDAVKNKVIGNKQILKNIIKYIKFEVESKKSFNEEVESLKKGLSQYEFGVL